MKPFLGLSDKERMFFAMLHDRSELEASIKEGSLLLLGELEYLLLIDNPGVEVEWSMEMGKDYFCFPVKLAGGGEVTCYVGFDYDRGFFPSVSSDRANEEDQRKFVDAVESKRDCLAKLGVIIDPDGTASIQEPGTPIEKVTQAEFSEWREDVGELTVGRIYNPGDSAFANRSVLKRIYATVQGLTKCLS